MVNVKSKPGKNSGQNRESETKTKNQKKNKTRNVKGKKKVNPKRAKKKVGVAVKIKRIIVLFLPITGKKMGIMAKWSSVHKCNIVTGPCYKHDLKNGNVADEKLLKTGLVHCFGIESIEAQFIRKEKIGSDHFHIYHIDIMGQGDNSGKILQKKDMTFMELTRLKSSKVIKVKGKPGEFTITRANRIGLIYLPKTSKVMAA